MLTRTTLTDIDNLGLLNAAKQRKKDQLYRGICSVIDEILSPSEEGVVCPKNETSPCLLSILYTNVDDAENHDKIIDVEIDHIEKKYNEPVSHFIQGEREWTEKGKPHYDYILSYKVKDKDGKERLETSGLEKISSLTSDLTPVLEFLQACV